MDTISKIKQQINDNPVVLYMKGTPQFPMCGFSAKVATILMASKVNFNFVNILEYPEIRKELPVYADWPTFPQLWVNQELIGGCDIVSELDENGELKNILNDSRILVNSEIKEA